MLSFPANLRYWNQELPVSQLLAHLPFQNPARAMLRMDELLPELTSRKNDPSNLEPCEIFAVDFPRRAIEFSDAFGTVGAQLCTLRHELYALVPPRVIPG